MSDIRQHQMLIDGEWVDASDGATFDGINPTTGEVWCRVAAASIR